MGYVKIDDNFFRHPKAIEAGRDGRILFIAGICYCGNSLTDGFVPTGAVTVLGAETGIAKPAAVAQTLTEVGLWEPTTGGFLVHDYLDYNTASEKVQAERVAARERMKRNRSPELRPNKSRSSPELRPNKSRSSPEVRQPETETETETPCSTEHGNEKALKPDPKPKRSQRVLTHLPTDFEVTDQMRHWAKSKKGLTDAEIDQRTDHFLNYVAKVGKQYVDWIAAWRDSMDWVPRNGVAIVNGQRSTAPSALDFAARARELERQGL